MPNLTTPAFRAIPRCEALDDRITPTVHIRFDYAFDTSGYFNAPERRAALEEVAATITANIGDSLTALTPSGTNTWQARTWNSATNSPVNIDNLAVGADEIVIYITAGNLGGALGIASGGAYSASGSQQWLNSVRTRGQAGVASGTDYATWGGLISFNSGKNFNFSGQPGASQFDFRSVASHELLHIFGFGLENPSYTRYTATGAFTGPNLVATAGYAVPLQIGEPDHFAPNTRYQGQESVMTPSVTAGQIKRIGALEYAVLRDIGWSPTPSQSISVPASPVQAQPAIAPAAVTSFVVGGGEGSAGSVTGYGANGQTVFSSVPFAGFLGGVRVATGDVNGDGVADLIAAAGPGGGPRVVVLDGTNGRQIASFFAFDPGFVNGVYVATGDFDSDGHADIVVAAGFGAGPHVKVFSGRNLGIELASFYTFDPRYVGGLDIATGDVNGDGTPEIVVGAIGGAIATFDGASIRAGREPRRLFADSLAFDIDYNGRISLAVGDVNGDGFADVIVGAGAGNGPRIAAFDGRQLLQGRISYAASFYAGDPNNRAGIRVAAADIDGDGREDIIAAPSPNSDSQVRVYSSRTGFGGTPPPWITLQNSSWAANGTYVG